MSEKTVSKKPCYSVVIAPEKPWGFRGHYHNAHFVHFCFSYENRICPPCFFVFFTVSGSQANYLKRRTTVVLRIDTPKHVSNESKMQNWYVFRRIKSVLPKLALLLRVWQRNFFSKLERRMKQRNSPFKKIFTVKNSSYIIFKFKHTIESGGVSIILNLVLCI